MRYLIKTLIVSLLIFGFSKSTFAQNAKADTDIQAVMEKYSAVGLAVVVVKENKIIYTHSFGQKDIENNVPLSNNDIFRIASISKSFSATSIMQLIAAGKLSLKDDFSNLVGFKVRNPKFPDKVITLKMVMSHTSSLNDSQGYFNLDAINPDKNPNYAKCYNDYEPGTGYMYCNLNYNMVGAVIEKLSGERFDNYVVNHVVRPLGLYGGYCVDSLDAARFVPLYTYDAKAGKYVADPMAYNPRREELKSYRPGYSTPVLSPTGGMKISATDLTKYMMMHMNYGEYNGVRIIPKKYSKLMQKQVADKEGYGLALRTLTDIIPGEIMKGHTGSAYGLYSCMFFHPKKKYGFVVITNGCRNPPYEDVNPILRETVTALYNHFVK